MRRAAAALAGAAVTAGVLRLWSARHQPAAAAAGTDTWQRTNFRGATVSLSGGLACAAGAAAAAAVAGLAGEARSGDVAGTRLGARPGTGTGARMAAAGVLATAGAGLLGLVDDRDPDPAAARGLRGHLRALSRGEVTTGTMKLLGIPALSVLAAALAQGPRTTSLLRQGADVLASGALIAGTANLVNLFDLRPGRALKVTGLLAAPLTLAPGPAGAVAAGCCGVVAAGWPGDLGERTMLGDTGANALGALVGTALALLPSAAVRGAALAGVVALIGASEKVSFSAVIDRVPALHALDAWGRRP